MGSSLLLKPGLRQHVCFSCYQLSPQEIEKQHLWQTAVFVFNPRAKAMPGIFITFPAI